MTTAKTPSQNFHNLYPEIDPTTPIRLGRGEHLAIVASTGILCVWRQPPGTSESQEQVLHYS